MTVKINYRTINQIGNSGIYKESVKEKRYYQAENVKDVDGMTYVTYKTIDDYQAEAVITTDVYTRKDIVSVEVYE